MVSQSNRFNVSEWRRLHELSGGKPIIIQDFNAAFRDPRYQRTEWQTMPTQEAAADVYSSWVTACARSGFVIAFNKCMYIDRFHTLWAALRQHDLPEAGAAVCGGRAAPTVCVDADGGEPQRARPEARPVRRFQEDRR